MGHAHGARDPGYDRARMARPRPIAIQVDSLLAGGAERVAVEVACALDRTRFTPNVLVTRSTGPLAALLDEGGVRTVILDRHRGFSPGKLARAVRVVRSCELLHVHKLEGGAWGSLIARAAHRPMIAHEHIWFGEPSRTRAFLYRFIIGPTATWIVGVSDVVSRSVIADGAPAAKVRTIPNGVRLGVAISREAARAELGLPLDAKVVGIIARLRPQKRHEALLEATAMLAARGRDFITCIVGDGLLRPGLEAQAKMLGIGDRVVFAGERPEAARLAAAFDVSVICSSTEGLPLAALEAMASGVPLVATAVSALPELLEGGAGVLVPPADDAALADAIDALLTDAPRARAFADVALARVRERYTFEGMVAAIETLYDDVLGQSTRSG